MREILLTQRTAKCDKSSAYAKRETCDIIYNFLSKQAFFFLTPLILNIM